MGSGGGGGGSSGNQRQTTSFYSHAPQYALGSLISDIASAAGYSFPGYNKTTGQANLQGQVQPFPTGVGAGGSFGGGGATGSYVPGYQSAGFGPVAGGYTNPVAGYGMQLNPQGASQLLNPMTEGSPYLTNMAQTPQGQAALIGSASPTAFNQLFSNPDIYGGSLQQMMAPYIQALGPYASILSGQSSLMPGAFTPANVPGVSPQQQSMGLAPIQQPGTYGGA